MVLRADSRILEVRTFPECRGLFVRCLGPGAPHGLAASILPCAPWRPGPRRNALGQLR